MEMDGQERGRGRRGVLGGDKKGGSWMEREDGLERVAEESVTTRTWCATSSFLSLALPLFSRDWDAAFWGFI